MVWAEDWRNRSANPVTLCAGTRLLEARQEVLQNRAQGKTNKQAVAVVARELAGFRSALLILFIISKYLSASSPIRTGDPQLRRLLLYPAEL